MKTTAEKKLLDSLEAAVVKGSKAMTAKEFGRAKRSTHKIAMEVIRKHEIMISLWRKMDKRIQAVAR